MFKAILLFIKAHTIATIVTTTVVVGTVVATPIVVENYKLDKNVKENLNMLVSSDYKATSDNTKEENNVILNNNEQPTENIPTNNKQEELTFTVKRIEANVDGGTSIEYKIIPSYDKDYSQWSKAEKEAYQKALEEIAEMVKDTYKNSVEKEEKIMADIERKLQLEENSWSKYYNFGTNSIAYNSYTKKYKGHISKGGKWNEQGVYVEKDGRDIDISREEFRSTVYYEIIQNIKNDEDSLQSDKDNYLSQLNEIYHLSD